MNAIDISRRVQKRHSVIRSRLEASRREHLPWRGIPVVRMPFERACIPIIVRVSLRPLDHQRLVILKCLGEQSRDNQLWTDHESDLFLNGTLLIYI